MKKIIFILFLLIILPPVIAEDQVVINSKNWQDIISGLNYAKLQDKTVNYIVEETQGVQLYTNILNPDQKEVLLIESENNFITGFKSSLEVNQFSVEKLNQTDYKQINLELAKRLVNNNIKNFVVLSDRYPYNAISVAPYALVSDSYILFVDKSNIQEINSFLEKNAENILIYGHLDREVKDSLKEFNPEVINTGDKFEDNIEVAKKFLSKKSTKQVIFTNGEIIEPSFFNNEFPVLFLGITNIPQQTIDFIMDSYLDTAVVVGYTLYPNALKIKELTNLRTILKYGQGREEKIFALDIYNLPSSKADLSIRAVRYNLITQQLEVIYENKAETYAYFQSISHKISSNEKEIASVGDEIPFFIDANEIKALTYDLDLIDYTDLELLASSTVVYGPTPKSMDNLLTQDTTIEIISVKDNSMIKIENLVYNVQTKRFEITINNIGEETVYADPEITDLMIAEEKITLSTETAQINPKQKYQFEIKALLVESDFKDNPEVNLYVRYGAREDSLIKSITQSLPLKIKSITPYIATGLILVALLIIFFFILKKRRSKDY